MRARSFARRRSAINAVASPAVATNATLRDGDFGATQTVKIAVVTSAIHGIARRTMPE